VVQFLLEAFAPSRSKPASVITFSANVALSVFLVTICPAHNSISDFFASTTKSAKDFLFSSDH